MEKLQEGISLLAQVMVVCKSRPEINLKKAIGQYEFFLLYPDRCCSQGTMPHCSMKSNLTILEKLPVGRAVDVSSGVDPSLVAEPCSWFNSDKPEPAEVEYK